MRRTALHWTFPLAGLAGCQALTGLDEVGVFVSDPPLDASTPQDSAVDGSAGKAGSSSDGGGGVSGAGGSSGTGSGGAGQSGAGGSIGQGGASGWGNGGTDTGGAAGAEGGQGGAAPTGREFNPCSFDSDCVSGLTCRAMSINGAKRCTRTCSTHSQCMVGTRCGSILGEKYCASDDDGVPCTTQSNCVEFCLVGPGANYCTSTCNSRADCPAGWGCSQSIGGNRVCLRLDVTCQAATDCAGQVCDQQTLVVSGCTMRCASALDCPQRPGALAPWKCEGGFCMRPSDIFGPVSINEKTQWACNQKNEPVNVCADGLTFDAPPSMSCPVTQTVQSVSSCTASCLPSGGCGKDHTCVAALVSMGGPQTIPICVRRGSAEIGSTCANNEDCLFSLCKNGKCSRDCLADNVCPSPFMCTGGVCQ